MANSFLFEGEMVNGRLSNEIWLAKNCPPEFQNPTNPWTEYASKIFEAGGDFRNWRHKRPEQEVEQQTKVYRFVDMSHASNSQLGKEMRIAIMGWMLSEILVEVPVYHEFSYTRHLY